VPVQAILEHGDKHYCFLYGPEGFDLREVRIGSTNDKFVVIREGLTEGEQVVRNPSAYREKVVLPELPKEESSPTLLAKAGAGGPAGKPGEQSRSPAREDQKADANLAAAVDQLLANLPKDADGVLKLTDLPRNTPENVRAWLAAADADHDGNVQRNELIDLAARRPPPRLAGKVASGATP
jgi:hypothetical protein